jgi:succinate dehydrogenase hydrophobic anchor subunit
MCANGRTWVGVRVTAVVLIAVIVVAIWVEFIWALIDAAHRPEYLYRPACRLSKTTTIFLIVITGFIGATYYFVRVRPSLIRASGVDNRPK